MREESRETIGKGKIIHPLIKPEGRAFAVPHDDLGNTPKAREIRGDVLPHDRVETRYFFETPMI
jgi:hypothetical protein